MGPFVLSIAAFAPAIAPAFADDADDFAASAAVITDDDAGYAKKRPTMQDSAIYCSFGQLKIGQLKTGQLHKMLVVTVTYWSVWSVGHQAKYK